MKRKVLTGLLAFGLLSACGEEPTQTPDAGEPVDTSCGIDCAAQEQYGLILNRCYEYSKTITEQAFPEIGVFVSELRDLEGGVKVIQVDYRQNGLIRMKEQFTIKNGDLYLARREFGAGESVTYKDASNAIVGVPVVKSTTQIGQNFEEKVSAHVVSGGTEKTDETTWRVNTLEPTNEQKKMAAGEFPEAIRLAITETPEHGKNSTRVLSRGTGFVVFSSTFELNSTATAQPYFLQTTRDITEGATPCGMAQ